MIASTVAAVLHFVPNVYFESMTINRNKDWITLSTESTSEQKLHSTLYNQHTQSIQTCINFPFLYHQFTLVLGDNNSFWLRVCKRQCLIIPYFIQSKYCFVNRHNNKHLLTPGVKIVSLECCMQSALIWKCSDQLSNCAIVDDTPGCQYH